MMFSGYMTRGGESYPSFQTVELGSVSHTGALAVVYLHVGQCKCSSCIDCLECLRSLSESLSPDFLPLQGTKIARYSNEVCF
jgi:hypothetical protein